MKTSWPKYLGLLGFIGLLSLVTGNMGLIGFFGFFGFFGFGKYLNDERLETNINKAAKNCFISSLIVYALTNIIFAFIPDFKVYAIAFSINFLLIILVFVISLKVYEGQVIND
ncbi:DUF3796 domain-containing protein [Phosphitispora sp. TUW77]|uniref:DUF3796 domain-containing protein n=1 Tax=Phosphitispora sp. TUW77 TaxID=3152361 RepID=UPI003AB84949